MSLLDNMPHEVSIFRHTHQRAVGKVASTRVSSEVATKVMSWVQNAGTRELNEWGKRDQTVTHFVLFNKKPDAKMGDVLEVTKGPAFLGDKLKLLTITERTAGLGWMWKALCEEDR